MKISFIEPRIELKPFIKSMWIFESPVGMPLSAAGLAAPSGSPKIIINYENTITTIVKGQARENKEHGFYFVGQRDIPVQIATPSSKTGFIGIEFSPFGAYPILGIPMIETTNRLTTIDELLGKWGRTLTEILHDNKTPKDKVDFIQNRLVELRRKRQIRNPLIEYCVNALKTTDGLISISELERKTGYSRRYFEILFKEHVGLTPKVLAGIFRFQKFYRKWATGQSYEEIKDELYNYYYDQAHFTKEFKRMTGFSPLHFANNVSNEFGRQLTIR
jgi:AraC-like DNA-binding protein